MLLTDKSKIEHICRSDILKLKYHEIDEVESWRVPYLTDLIEVRNGLAALEGFNQSEIDDIINFLCVT